MFHLLEDLHLLLEADANGISPVDRPLMTHEGTVGELGKADMAERTIERDEPVMDEQGEALRHAMERAERAEAELAKLKAKSSSNVETAEAAGSKVHAVPTGDAAPRGTSSTARPDPSGKHLVEPGSMDREKQPAAQSPEGHAVGDVEAHGVDALRDDSMMAHLLDSLGRGEDIGHYGRLTFAMIARHFLSDDEVLAELTKDEDFSEEDARQMLVQVEGRDYSPPRRDRIMQWQSEQEFAIIPNPDDPDCGNVYKSLRFPKETYSHIGHYQDKKSHS